jgi:diguanylate cyclase (GGDEF)-like protein
MIYGFTALAIIIAGTVFDRLCTWAYTGTGAAEKLSIFLLIHRRSFVHSISLNNDSLRSLYGRAFDLSSNICMVFNERYELVLSNASACRHFVHNFSTIDGCQLPSFQELSSDLINAPSLENLLQNCLAGHDFNGSFNLVFSNRSLSGDLHLERVCIHSDEQLHSKQNSQVYILLVFYDCSSYVRLRHRMTNNEFIDPDSGLLNNKALDVMLEMSLDKAIRTGNNARLAIMMLQVSNLEHLETIFSDAVYREVFGQLARMVKLVMPNNDLVFRYDNNRIVVIIDEFENKSDLLFLAENLENQIATPYAPVEKEIHLQSCIGITVFPDDGLTKAGLLSNASAALTHGLMHNQPWLMYNRDIQQMAMEKLTLRSGLSSAIRNNELELRYMTFLDASGQVKGLEALVRWRHPSRGLMGPGEFLPVAIHTRVIGAISRWVIFRIIEDYERYFFDKDIFITFNITAIDLADLYLPDSLENALRGRMPHSAIKVEITESECMENYDQAMQALHQFLSRNIEVLIDDFGEGHSSLSYLKDLPAQYAKIDKSFLDGITEQEKDFEFLGHVLALCRLRGLKTILEGVETEAQYEMLKGSGADLFQGHLFGKPMPVEELLERYF